MLRHERLAQAIKKEVSSIIHDELKDPRVGFVTITDVELSKDLRHAKIFYSVLGEEEECVKTKEALESSLGYIRTLIAERIRMRFVPELMFRQDASVQYSARIEEILHEIHETKESDEHTKSNRKRKKT